MTNKTLARLWWRQNWTWMQLLMAGILLVGMGTAVSSTRGWQAGRADLDIGYRLNAADYRRHPETYRIHGKPAASERAYYDHIEQFFEENEFKNTDGHIPVTGFEPNHYYYVLALLAGLVIAFWERRTHRLAFLLSLGVTRWQVWCAQLSLLGAIMGTAALSQLLHYLWIVAVIPQKYQLYLSVGPLMGSNIAIILTSGCVAALGWLIGNVTDHFWLAGLVGFLTWRWGFGMLTRTNFWLQPFGVKKTSDVWLYEHCGVASGLAAIGLVVLLALTWLTLIKWSAEVTPQGLLSVVVFGILASIGIGTVVGDMMIAPFWQSAIPWYEYSGMLLTLLCFAGYWLFRCQQIRGQVLCND
ncbi:hypothetical protein [Lactiplantibacillus herbarum]|uniref:hypothetical protein n=1 Tax=Lactiplantibacillus herbarum TaxID=1670446 RepID=UPI00069D5F3E|nr:hypothetical protein [Lactiplantibacillus herbarum]